MPKPPSQGKLLYHITHIENLQSILLHGLRPRKYIESHKFAITDIADPDIINKREFYESPLSQYVPFHFYAKNPFDGVVCRAYGSHNMAIITIQRSLHSTGAFNGKFFIIPSHPLDTGEAELLPYDIGINRIRWDILDMQEGRDYHDPEIRKACLAECVVDSVIPSCMFYKIFVQKEETEERILHMNNPYRVEIIVNPYMFP